MDCSYYVSEHPDSQVLRGSYWYFVPYISTHPCEYLFHCLLNSLCTNEVSFQSLLSPVWFLLPLPKEGGYVFRSVCLLVCVSVHYITEKVVNGF